MIHAYLPYHICVLRAVCKSWLSMYPSVAQFDQITWELIHNVDIINKNPQSTFFQNACRSTSFTKIYEKSEHSHSSDFRISTIQDALIRTLINILDKQERPATAVKYVRIGHTNRCDHLCDEDVAEVTPTTPIYWRAIIDAEIKNAKHSVVMNYVKKCRFGAIHLIEMCYEQGRTWLARRIFANVVIVEGSNKIITKLTKYTDLIKILNKRIDIDRNILIRGAVIHDNLELLDWLLGNSFGRRQIRIIFNTINTYHSDDPELSRWLHKKCKTGGRGLSKHLISIFNKQAAEINGTRAMYFKPPMII